MLIIWVVIWVVYQVVYIVQKYSEDIELLMDNNCLLSVRILLININNLIILKNKLLNKIKSLEIKWLIMMENNVVNLYA
jgi:hypothetical protein